MGAGRGPRMSNRADRRWSRCTVENWPWVKVARLEDKVSPKGNVWDVVGLAVDERAPGARGGEVSPRSEGGAMVASRTVGVGLGWSDRGDRNRGVSVRGVPY